MIFYGCEGVFGGGHVHMGSACEHPPFTLKLNSPGGIEPQPIKLEFTIYPAELWIYFDS